MRKISLFIFLVSIFCNAQVSYSQLPEGVDSFKQNKDSWRRKEEPQVKKENVVIQKIKDGVPKFGLNNILEAEQIFCFSKQHNAP